MTDIHAKACQLTEENIQNGLTNNCNPAGSSNSPADYCLLAKFQKSYDRYFYFEIHNFLTKFSKKFMIHAENTIGAILEI